MSIIDYFIILLDIYDTCKGYSRRLSAKLVDTTIQYDGALSGALEKAIERKLDQQKPKEKIKFIIKK